MTETFYWHDYETWGADPRRDRAAQFAGVRTDRDLNIVEDPLTLFCRPADDMLPQPEACLVTGIAPQKALRDGVPEAEFFRLIHQEMARPNTCSIGYNSIRFDDEVTRYGLYRNFLDPYAREWQNGNSRWDVIDMARLTRALRPQGIEWTNHPDGRPSFRLEALTRANGIEHQAAHDALADVYATIAITRLIKTHQPRLYDYLYRMRSKHQVIRLLDLSGDEPVIHVSAMYPSEYCGLALVAPLARHPLQKNGIVVFDLRHDPAPLLELEPEEIRTRLFTQVKELPDGIDRMPLKTVHLNRSPVVVPINTLSADAADRLNIDVAAAMRHFQRLRKAEGLAHKIQEVLRQPPDFKGESDPDLSLYGGGFFSESDRRRIDEIRKKSPQQLIGFTPDFEDERLPELLFRYRARNWPETLSHEELERWTRYRSRRLTDSQAGGSITADAYRKTLKQLSDNPQTPIEQRPILDELAAYIDGLSIDG